MGKMKLKLLDLGGDAALDVRFRPARRDGDLLDVAQFWSRKKKLPGIMLETQNNNLAACRLYERCGFVVGGVDHSPTGAQGFFAASRDGGVLTYRGGVDLAAEVGGIGANRERCRELLDLDATHFSWVGSPEPGGVFYYRVHSPVILIEFDHQR